MIRNLLPQLLLSCQNIISQPICQLFSAICHHPDIFSFLHDSLLVPTHPGFECLKVSFEGLVEDFFFDLINLQFDFIHPIIYGLLNIILESN